MISCEQAAILCNKTQYRESTFIEKLKLRYHLFVCKQCASFTQKNTQLTTLCEQAELNALSEKEKEVMKDKLRKRSEV